MTLAVLLAIASSAQSGEITQTVDFRFAEHDTYFSFFNQFDPTLGTLTRVDVAVSGTFTGYDVAFVNTSRTDTVSFNGFINAQLNTDAGSTDYSSTIASQLQPLGTVIESLNYPYPGFYEPFSLLSSYSGASAGPWIGTGVLAPFQTATNQYRSMIQINGYADDPRITTRAYDEPFANITGGETVTYFYQPVGTVPEPSTLMLSATAAIVLTGAGYIKRKRGK